MPSVQTQNHLQFSAEPLSVLDPEINACIQAEIERQQNHIELIASENFTLPAILQATGSVLTNKYAEGYPKKRYYGGCEYVDGVEQLAIDRAKELFGAEHANVQPHSGSQANIAVYFAALEPGDKLLTMSLDHGGHLTHGHPKNLSGTYFNIVHYGVSQKDGCIDYDHLEALALKEKPKMITVGASAYPRRINFERIGKIAKKSGALLMADIAHIAGLVVTKEHPSPIEHADFVTTTTHKTLRGPRGGLILCKKAYAQAIDSAIFPGTQGGPLMHIIAAKAVCFLEALKPSFAQYQKQIRKNAQALAKALIKSGYYLCSGGTDNHLVLIDLRPTHPELTGKYVQNLLDQVHITTNKNNVPNETRSPFQSSGLRLGTPAVTSRGMKEKEMETIAKQINLAISEANKPEALNEIKREVIELCRQFPLPY